ncbi:uncharacterized protein LOC141578672 [Camelus bactrianus]|uniref:Uncharacterized protein LOC141578672 n=1 Tax=Camelus bactrianus TaxID=9837 RepID=A0AC58QWR6_CAMBA
MEITQGASSWLTLGSREKQVRTPTFKPTEEEAGPPEWGYGESGVSCSPPFPARGHCFIALVEPRPGKRLGQLSSCLIRTLAEPARCVTRSPAGGRDGPDEESHLPKATQPVSAEPKLDSRWSGSSACTLRLLSSAPPRGCNSPASRAWFRGAEGRACQRSHHGLVHGQVTLSTIRVLFGGHSHLMQHPCTAAPTTLSSRLTSSRIFRSCFIQTPDPAAKPLATAQVSQRSLS